VASGAPADRESRLDLIDAVIYGDCFDCAMRIEEVARGSRTGIGTAELQRILDEDPDLAALVTVRDGLVCLSGREELLEVRAERIARADRMTSRATRVAGVLRRAPFVRGIALTGSLAAGDALPGADTDILVICKGRRIGTVFLLLAAAGRLTGKLLCPNFYLAEDRLGLSARNVYEEHELLNAKPIWGLAHRLHSENPWLFERFPNSGPGGITAADETPVPTRTQRILERVLGGRAGARLEEEARRIARARLVAHYGRFGQEVPGEVIADLRGDRSLQFHGGDWPERIAAEYDQRRSALAQSC
jgi:predicted nucleotidyltransferase